MSSLLDQRDESDSWKRRYIREIISACEAHSYCFQAVLKIDQTDYQTVLNKKELKLLDKENLLSTEHRLKYTLRVVHKVFELKNPPKFDGENWEFAKQGIFKRHLLNHPKQVSDLTICDDQWCEIETGLIWLIQQYFNLLSKLQDKYLG